MNNFKSFQTHGTKGVTDLISWSPYTGEWSTFSPAFPITEEEYLADIESYQLRVMDMNDKYIAELKESGEYGKDFTTTFNFQNIPEFNDHTDGSNYKEQTFGEFSILMPLGSVGKDSYNKLPAVKYWSDDDPRKYKEAQEIHDRLTFKKE